METPAVRPRILIVDDDPAIRLLCSINLRLAGLDVDVVEAPDGPRALAYAHAEAPDVILTGVGMRPLDGFQLAAELRNDPHTRTIPIIFVSAETTAANQARARLLGALAYLTKPFDPVALASLVAAALPQRSY